MPSPNYVQIFAEASVLRQIFEQNWTISKLHERLRTSATLLCHPGRHISFCILFKLKCRSCTTNAVCLDDKDNKKDVPTYTNARVTLISSRNWCLYSSNKSVACLPVFSLSHLHRRFFPDLHGPKTLTGRIVPIIFYPLNQSNSNFEALLFLPFYLTA